MPQAMWQTFNVVSVGPLGYGPRIFLQQVWDVMSQNIASADSPVRKQMELVLTTWFDLV